MPKSDHMRGVLICLAGVLVLSPDSLLLRLVTEADSWAAIFWRGVFQAVALCAVVAIVNRKDLTAPFRQMGLLNFGAGVLFGISGLTFVTSINLTSVANTLVILAAMPFFAAGLSWLVLRERVPMRTWLATIAAIIGMAILFSGSLGGGAFIGDLCALAAAISWAGTLIVFRKLGDVDPMPALAIGAVLSALVAAPLSSDLSLTPHDLGVLAVNGLILLPLSFTLIAIGPRYLPAAEVSLIMLLETILGPYWVWLIVGETPSMETFLGGCIVVAALLLHAAFGFREVRRLSAS